MKNKLIVAAIAAAMGISAAVADPATTGSGTTFEQMQANFKTMQQMMDRYHGTKDPKERAALYAQHMQAMQSGMAMMQSMGPSMGMGGGMDGGMGMGGMSGGRQGSNMSPEMMQAMMAQLLEHEAARQPSKP